MEDKLEARNLINELLGTIDVGNYAMSDSDRGALFFYHKAFDLWYTVRASHDSSDFISDITIPKGFLQWFFGGVDIRISKYDAATPNTPTVFYKPNRLDFKTYFLCKRLLKCIRRKKVPTFWDE